MKARKRKMAKREKMVTRTTTCTRATVEGFKVETKEIVKSFVEIEGKIEDNEVLKFEASNSGYFVYEVLEKEYITEKRAMPYSVWIRYSKPVNGEENEVDE